MRDDVQEAFGDEGAAALASPIEHHLQALASERAMPNQALAICTARADEAAPALIAVLARAADGEDLSESDDNLLFRGLHVLGAARVTAACADLLRFLRRSDEALDDLIGDALTTSVPKILIGVFDGNADALLKLAAERTVGEFVRHAALGAATYLVWEGRMDRDLMRSFLVRFLDENMIDDGDMVCAGWLEAISLIPLEDLAPLVRKAWDDDRIFEVVLDRADFESDLADAKAAPEDPSRFATFGLGYIEDVVESLAWVQDADETEAFASREDDAALYRMALDIPEPIRNPLRNVGRNDPCPCGSGKKAKKCCLSTG